MLMGTEDHITSQIGQWSSEIECSLSLTNYPCTLLKLLLNVSLLMLMLSSVPLDPLPVWCLLMTLNCLRICSVERLRNCYLWQILALIYCSRTTPLLKLFLFYLGISHAPYHLGIGYIPCPLSFLRFVSRSWFSLIQEGKEIIRGINLELMFIYLLCFLMICCKLRYHMIIRGILQIMSDHIPINNNRKSSMAPPCWHRL